MTQIAENKQRKFDNNIFINFLDVNVTEKQLKEKFEAVGAIVSVRLRKSANKPFQSAMVLYAEYASAQKAIQKFHDTYELCSGRPLQVDVYISKEEKKILEEESKRSDLEKLIYQFQNITLHNK